MRNTTKIKFTLALFNLNWKLDEEEIITVYLIHKTKGSMQHVEGKTVSQVADRMYKILREEINNLDDKRTRNKIRKLPQD